MTALRLYSEAGGWLYFQGNSNGDNVSISVEPRGVALGFGVRNELGPDFVIVPDAPAPGAPSGLTMILTLSNGFLHTHRRHRQQNHRRWRTDGIRRY